MFRGFPFFRVFFARVLFSHVVRLFLFCVFCLPFVVSLLFFNLIVVCFLCFFRFFVLVQIGCTFFAFCFALFSLLLFHLLFFAFGFVVFAFAFCFPRQCGHTRVLTVVVIRCYLHYIHASRNPRLRRLAESGGLARALVATAHSSWHCAHFRALWSLLVAGAKETSCFGGPKSTFRDRYWSDVTSTRRLRGRHNTSDTGSSARSNFVTGANESCFGHVGRFQTSREARAKAAFWRCLLKRSCSKKPWQGCAM